MRAWWAPRVRCAIQAAEAMIGDPAGVTRTGPDALAGRVGSGMVLTAVAVEEVGQVGVEPGDVADGVGQGLAAVGRGGCVRRPDR